MTRRQSHLITAATLVFVLGLSVFLMLKRRAPGSHEHALETSSTSREAPGNTRAHAPHLKLDWEELPGKLASLAPVEAEAAWGVEPEQNLVRFAGGRWQRVEPNIGFVDAAADGSVWAVKTDGTVLERAGEAWTERPGRYTRLSVGSSLEVWALDTDDHVFRWDGTHWIKKPGKLSQVSVGRDGSVFGVNRQRRAYRWAGSDWRRIGSGFQSISTGDATHVWALDEHGRPQRFVEDHFEVAGSSERLRAIEVAADGRVFAISDAGRLLRSRR
jgi:hypothetical protein